MSDQDDSAEKSHEPSPRKLEEARKKGEIPRAPDLSTAMSYLGLLLCGLLLGGSILREFANALLPLIEQPDRLHSLFFKDGAQSIAGNLLSATLVPTLPILTIPGIMVLLTLLASRGILFTPSKLVPKGQRLDPISNAKNKFGRRGLFEFFKSFVKLTVYSICLALFLSGKMEQIIGSIYASAPESVVMMTELMMQFLILVVLIAMTIGGLDFFWQRAEHMRKNRMTLKELRDEFKESEGDPHFKQARRGRAQEIALAQMMGVVPDADVVIVNPTHYAVALKWSRMPGAAPECVAKGVDQIALRIREIAEENKVPIHSDPPTARALYATTEIGDEISAEHYKPVAAAIRFAEKMRAKARTRGW
ncbi:EscU/YscU/HrcU family type III secretion system export apparatus switch protein [Tropicibacter oceani]|uniref:Flagellar type III secretion system protein FlhB n=1 Tax=Tropicibacter oceani TaxID=3058420 RepID=A0ABY8QJ41_9RHOB|nr:flagellar type III secretion system protein FlhB [Tropicibacter oceani]WGW04639.1 flagellar type III secretion system protein FlhB [Tropicibacter oceani]